MNDDYLKHSIHQFGDSDSLKEAIAKEYKGEYLFREIALFAGSKQTNFVPILIIVILLRMFTPFIYH